MNYTQTLELSQFEPTDKPKWLVNYNGDMEKIDQNATKNDERHVNVVASFAAVEVRLEDGEKRLDDAETRLDGLETGMGGQDQKLVVMQSNIDQIHHETVLNTEAIQKLQTGQGAQGTDITAMKQNITSLQGDVSQIENDISTVETSLSTLETTLATVESELTTVTTDVNTAKQEIVAAQDDISHLDTMYEAQQESIDSLNLKIANIYIDFVNGSDTNDGTESSPVKTPSGIDKVISRTKPIFADLHLVNFDQFSGSYIIRLDSINVRLIGELRIPAGSVFKVYGNDIILSNCSVITTGGNNAHFTLDTSGMVSIDQNNVTLNASANADSYIEIICSLLFIRSINLSGRFRLSRVCNIFGEGLETLKPLLFSTHYNILPGTKANYPNIQSTDNMYIERT